MSFVFRDSSKLTSLRPRVLIVDDESELTGIYAEALSEMELEIEIANDGNEAFEKVESFDPDLILADLKMPLVRGDELLLELRRQGYEIPIIIITGFSEKEILVKCMRYNAFDFLHKPVDLSLLQVTVQKALDWEIKRVRDAAMLECALLKISSVTNLDEDKVLKDIQDSADDRVLEQRSKTGEK